jgi:hypothetical protein
MGHATTICSAGVLVVYLVDHVRKDMAYAATVSMVYVLMFSHLTKHSTFHTAIYYGHSESSKGKIVHVDVIKAF